MRTVDIKIIANNIKKIYKLNSTTYLMRVGIYDECWMCISKDKIGVGHHSLSFVLKLNYNNGHNTWYLGDSSSYRLEAEEIFEYIEQRWNEVHC